MTYLKPDNRRKNKRARFYIVVGVCLVILILLSVFAPHLFSPIIQAVDRPVSSASSGIGGGLADFLAFFRTKAGLEQENANLESDLAADQAVIVERDFYEDEASTLLDLASSSPANFVIAPIISKPGFSPYDTFVIGIGSHDDVKAGQAVLTDKTTVIGRVSSAEGGSATVILASSPGESTSVLVGSTSIETTATGLGGGNFQIKLPRSVTVKVGDFVSLASSPQEMFGVIGSVEAGPSDSFETALFRSPINVNALRFVFVDTSPL
jgi:cell shape-determining protein MreC